MAMSATATVIRRYDLDWLRVCAVLGVFFYHSLHFFDTGDWAIKNATTYPWVDSLMALLAMWVMPLIFVISGASLFYASRKGNAASFAWDKVLRLLVPLWVGVFTFSVTQVYVERVNHGQFQGTLLEFLPHYFDGLYGFGGNFAFHGIHLWYLLILFIFTILLMPVFWWFKGATGDRVLRRLGDLLALPGAIILFLAPTLALRVITDSGALGGGYALGGWRPVQYLWFLLAGYLIVSHERLQQRIIQARWICLMLAVLLVTLSFAQQMGPDGYRILAVWPGLLAMLGFAMKQLTFSNRFLAYSNEAVLPFYILHHNVLVWVGFFVVGWAMSDFGKYLIIMLTSFVTCVLLYEYLVRRFNVLRVLFGLKLPRREQAVAKVAMSISKS
jgi:peptidoglycan/LPS O-acetylase OafA/YrhL